MGNKRNLKEERGITLLALIITIIIIVIIAAITINAAYMSGIIQFGVNGAKDYAQAAIEENRIMEETGNYVESVTKKIKVLLGEEPPTNPELKGMDWFVKGVTQPAEESKEVADFYAKNQPNGTLIIYPKNGVEATIEYVEIEVGEERGSVPPWTAKIITDMMTGNSEFGEKITSVYVAKGMRTETCEMLFAALLNCTKIDLANLDTSQVRTMNDMFYNCTSLENIDLAGLDSQLVMKMSSMFQNCSSLASIDLTNLNVENVLYMENMFEGCINLETVNLKDLNAELMQSAQRMFYRV